MALHIYERFSFFALFVGVSLALPFKGSKSTDPAGSDLRGSPNYGSHRRAASEPYTPTYYSAPEVVRQPVAVWVQEPGYSKAAHMEPAPGHFSSPGTDYTPSAVSYPVPAEYAGGDSQPAPQVGLPETSWLVPPQSFQDSADTVDSSEFLLPAPQAPIGPVLQSGETSNIVKEAELGNYQHQTEEFGYPAEQPMSQPGLTNFFVPGLGQTGFWGLPYPGFDYRLLYGLYPPGTYTTFSHSHERGKDYYKNIHYLREHEDEEGPGDQHHHQQQQQQKIFPGSLQTSTD